MDDIATAIAEERKGRTAAKAVLLMDHFEDMYVANPVVGDTATWEITNPAMSISYLAGEKVYHYAAVFTGSGQWFVTGNPSGFRIEEFIDYLVDAAVRGNFAGLGLGDSEVDA